MSLVATGPVVGTNVDALAGVDEAKENPSRDVL